ncbi:MAG: outer membrane protein assembly factor BamD [Chthoniobacteraceae bacterium]
MTAILCATPLAGAVDILGLKLFGDKKAGKGVATQAQESEADQELHRGEALETEGRTEAALKVFHGIVKSGTLTAAAPKAQLHIGHILERKGKYPDAFKAYSAYTTKYPSGTDFDSVIQSQFDIAKMFLGGKKTKVLGIPVSPSYKRAEEMFAEIVKHAPFHRLAPMAQFNVGQALEKETKVPEAIAAYREVISRYPGDPVASDAQYQLGYVQFHESQTGSYNEQTRQRAVESFEEYLNRQPKSEKTAQARENIKALTAAEIKNTLGIAKFYDKAKNYKAAVVYYNEVIRGAPGGPESDQARKRIEELKGTVGAEALRTGPEKAQTGEMALARRRAQARVDVASRPDYNGPYVPLPPMPDDGRPRLRTPGPIGPVTEPALPVTDPLQDPSVPKLRTGDPLIPLAPLPPVPEEPKPGAEPSKKPQ